MVSSVVNRGRLLTLEQVQRLDLKKDPGPLSIFGALDEKRAPCRKQSAQPLAGNQSRQSQTLQPPGASFPGSGKGLLLTMSPPGSFPFPAESSPACATPPGGSRRMDGFPKPKRRDAMSS